MTSCHKEIKDQKQILLLYSNEEGDGEIDSAESESTESDLPFDRTEYDQMLYVVVDPAEKLNSTEALVAHVFMLVMEPQNFEEQTPVRELG